MGDVFANGREVSGKATPNKSIAAFPSVCLSPPSPPAGPIPIPYPVTSMGTDTSDGTGSVKIKKKEGGKKNGSVYKKCNGNQPATKSFGMDVLSHVTEGKTKFAAYSFDVLFEKGGAERFLDLTTSNHMNSGGAPSPSASKPDLPKPPTDADCAALESNNAEVRSAVSAEMPTAQATNINNNHTVASGVYAPPGGSSISFVGSSASRLLRTAFKNFSQPISSARSRWMPVIARWKKDGEPVYKNHIVSQACHNCSQPIGGQQGHAELNIINDIGRQMGNAPGGTLLLAIDWRSRGKQKPPEPCPNCQNRIRCFCEEKCMTILICTKEGKPVDVCKEGFEKA